ncbi:hypothetical protein TCON_2144 [Astathelohania contejeani]|uniref:Uncharacterized protein n=1 Tax=Astathelohania contejeani TaxID=164912 RepID=A0ABQ7HWV6_9MICR|nr:hypothetical protein TCON_2144 [Thelohania contejeani]
MSNKNPFSSLKSLTDNPYDVFNPNIIIPEKNEDKNEIKRENVDDSFIFEILKRPKEKIKINTSIQTDTIYNYCKLVTKIDKCPHSEKYYKFPFDNQIKNDRSELFSKIFSEWQKAFKAAFFNYKIESKPFYLQIKDEVLVFNGELKTTIGFQNKLRDNEIEYTIQNGWCVIKGIDISLVYDFIMNTPVSANKTIPFIISKYEFENAIIYSSKWKSNKPVMKNGEIYYNYNILGYFIGEDYKEYLRDARSIGLMS